MMTKIIVIKIRWSLKGWKNNENSPDILEVEAPSQAWDDSNNLAWNKQNKKIFILKFVYSYNIV